MRKSLVLFCFIVLGVLLSGEANAASYTKLDADGNEGTNADGSWSMVRDNDTGLTWEVKTNNGDWSLHEVNNRYTWYNANDAFIVQLNTQEFGGYSDWRLPTIYELFTILDLSRAPAIDTDFFPNTISLSGSWYWTSTNDAFNFTNAWRVTFRNDGGGCNLASSKYGNENVRAVRGEMEYPPNSFQNNNDGTISDIGNRLMWQRDSFKANSWEDGISKCENLNLANYTDWRLPSIIELLSIVDYSAWNPAINSMFSIHTDNEYLSSTLSLPDPLKIWAVAFQQGVTDTVANNSIYYFRAVRTIPPHPPTANAGIDQADVIVLPLMAANPKTLTVIYCHTTGC